MSKRKPTATAPREKPVDHVIAAGDQARDLGHKTMTTGRVVACWHCAMDGIVGPDGACIGSIFERSCAK